MDGSVGLASAREFVAVENLKINPAPTARFDDGQKVPSTVTSEAGSKTKELSMRWTGNRLWLAAGLAAGLVAVSVWPGVAVRASSVTGTVTFDGKAPALKPLAMDADPACAKKHSAPVPSETLVLGTGNTMGNVIV